MSTSHSSLNVESLYKNESNSSAQCQPHIRSRPDALVATRLSEDLQKASVEEHDEYEEEEEEDEAEAEVEGRDEGGIEGAGVDDEEPDGQDGGLMRLARLPAGGGGDGDGEEERSEAAEGRNGSDGSNRSKHRFAVAWPETPRAPYDPDFDNSVTRSLGVQAEGMGVRQPYKSALRASKNKESFGQGGQVSCTLLHIIHHIKAVLALV